MNPKLDIFPVGLNPAAVKFSGGGGGIYDHA